MGDENFPVRRKLCHEVPMWVGMGSRHFITINCRERGVPTLTSPDVALDLLKSIDVYEEQHRWYPWLAVVMPDHVHLIATFNLDVGIKPAISAWKRFHARISGIKWQSDFFEHRLRNNDEFVEKAEYVRQNPVRKGLVGKIEDWAYLWERRM